MNKPILSIKKSASPTPLITRAVVTRKRKYVVAASDLLDEPVLPKPTLVSPRLPTPNPKRTPARKVTKPTPEPVIPREERIAACFAELRVTWPLLFDEVAVVLWGVGIRNRIWRALNKKYSRTLISATLARWQDQHPQYRELLKTSGTPRYGLEGTVTMHVTEEQARHALTPG